VFERLQDRRYHIGLFFSIVFIALVVRLAVVTIVQGDEYLEKSLNYRLKKIPEYAKRGEIYDRNGVLLAGNQPAFTVSLMGSNLSKVEMNKVSKDLIDLLDQKGEEHIDFPIHLTPNGYVYAFDESVQKWLLENNYPLDYTAKQVFADYRTKEQISDTLNDQEAYSIMIQKGIILPISISKMEFWEERQKGNFLKLYQLEPNVSATEAFKAIRNYKSFQIDPTLSDQDAYKILILRHALKEKGFLKYEPIKVASNIKKETAILLSEMAMDLKGVTVGVEPVRTYPNKNMAAHILGYMGKIAREDEIEKYVKGLGYEKNRIIGKGGIEGKFETDLNGKDGYKFIEIDASGRMVREVEKDALGEEGQPSSAGKDIKLTIDATLQKNLEIYLKRASDGIMTGGSFESKYGNYNYSEAYPNANTGAGIVVDVKTGEVLAMASYPNYDLNLFSTGISNEDWNKLSPENPSNPLSPRPLFNMATMTGVQPGSIYKVATAYAALEEGLSPYESLYDDGFIEIGGHSFGCLLWNKYRSKHGHVNLNTAMEVSCNYYFYDIASGYDYATGRKLNYTMTTNKLLTYSKDFGLDERTGLEIEEAAYGIPDPESKKKSIQNLLKSKLKTSLKDYFPAEKVNTPEKLEELANTIVSWSENNASRTEIIKNLENLGANKGTLEKLADIIKYDYFNQMKFHEGDLLNLSIGQGDHKYTVAQMARYIMTVANDGYAYPLSVVKEIGNQPKTKPTVEKIQTNNPQTFEYLRTAMSYVAQGEKGSARSIFRNFPVKVGAKTGTAQKQGKIPPKDEIAYFKTYLSRIDGRLSFSQVQAKTKDVLKERNEELAKLKNSIKTMTNEEEKQKVEKKINSLVVQGYLKEENAMRFAIKSLSSRNLTDEQINAYRADFGEFAWFVAFAPLDDPQIAVVVLVPEGGHGGYTGPIVRELIGDYLKIPATNKAVNPSTSDSVELNSN
jgi:penicillin-binding protein 2